MPASRSFALSSAAPQHSSPFYQKHKMSLTQTYYLAHTARSKLSKEAAKPEYDLRVLVGHANMLDGLMIELAEVEREQENWFNQSVRTAQSTTSATKSTKSTTITWADTLPAVVEDESSSSSSDESDESDEEMLEADEPVVTRRRAPTPTYASVTEMEVDESESDSDDIAEDEESDSDELALVRTDSRSSFTSPPSSPPELLHEFETEDEEEDDDDESVTPPSPPTATFPAPAPQQKQQTGHTVTVALKQQHDDYSQSARVPELYI